MAFRLQKWLLVYKTCISSTKWLFVYKYSIVNYKDGISTYKVASHLTCEYICSSFNFTPP